MLGILAGTLFGVLLGTVSGLVPGIHANTMAGILLGLQLALLPWFGPEALAATMFAALITHTFLDIIPSTFLGIPDPETALAVLPAHALCLEGKGEEAVRVGALGSACAASVAVPLAVALFFVLPPLQPFLDWGIGILLVAVAGYMIISGESPGWALAVFLVSGLLGVFSLRFDWLAWHTIGGTAVLMPLLTGLFGISVLLFASQGPLPPQRFSGLQMSARSIGKGTLIGTLVGTVVGWLPGLSNATANAVLTSVTRYENDRREYILATSAANTANAIIGLAALFALSRARNGVMVAVSSLEAPSMTALLACGAIAATFAYLLTVVIAKSASRLNGIDGKALNYGVIVFIVALSLIISGPFGGLVLVLATAVGLVPQLLNIPRLPCMGVVMVPVILFSFGVAIL
jgi:putative membrane protein